jgi:hypothetical protein
MQIKLNTLELGRKNQNHAAEWEIAFLARHWKLQMQKKKVPTWLWDYCLVYKGKVLSWMSHGKDSRSGYEMVTGNTDISKWLDFEFYGFVWWINWPN